MAVTHGLLDGIDSGDDLAVVVEVNGLDLSGGAVETVRREREQEGCGSWRLCFACFLSVSDPK